MKKKAYGDSNDSEDDNASLMSVNEAINELEDDFLRRKRQNEVSFTN